jgi:hypothetical protein
MKLLYKLGLAQRLYATSTILVLATRVRHQTL